MHKCFVNLKPESLHTDLTWKTLSFERRVSSSEVKDTFVFHWIWKKGKYKLYSHMIICLWVGGITTMEQIKFADSIGWHSSKSWGLSLLTEKTILQQFPSEESEPRFSCPYHLTHTIEPSCSVRTVDMPLRKM